MVHKHIKAMYLPGIGTHVVIVRQRDSNRTRLFPSIFFFKKASKETVFTACNIYTHTRPYSQFIVSVVMVCTFHVGQHTVNDLHNTSYPCREIETPECVMCTIIVCGSCPYCL